MRVGIDLGTTYSLVAYVDKDGIPRIINNHLERSSTPSIISFTDNGILFGDEARIYQSNGSGRSISAFKRKMGDLSTIVTYGQDKYNAEDLSSMFLSYLIDDSEKTIGEKIDSAVITVPAYFDDIQRRATIRAAERAGVKVLSVVNEPTAAALYYGMGGLTDGRIIVYDLGGGTFDITFFEIRDGNIEVLGTDGDSRLGGKDWDYQLMDYIFGLYYRDYEINPNEDLRFMSQYLVEAERYKHILSDRESVDVVIDYDGVSAQYTVERSVIDFLTRGLVQRTLDICEGLLHSLNLKWSDFDSMILTGGATRIPSVSRMLDEGTQGIRILAHDDTDLAVAKGAALFALSDGGVIRTRGVPDGTRVTDAIAHSLGIVSVSTDRTSYINNVVIAKNTPIPCCRRVPLEVDRGNYTKILEVYVLQGESVSPLGCSVVSRSIIRGFNNPGSGVRVDVEYCYRADGTIEVKAYQDERLLEVIGEDIPPDTDLSWMGRPPMERNADAVSLGENMHICLAVDLSESIVGEKLLKVVDSIKGLIRRLPQAVYTFVYFADKCITSKARLTSSEALDEIGQICDDQGKLVRRLLRIGVANSSSPFGRMKRCLSNSGEHEERLGIVLTDGIWRATNENPILASKRCMDSGIKIIAMGFGDVDTSFLKKVSNTKISGKFEIENIGRYFDTVALAIGVGLPVSD